MAKYAESEQASLIFQAALAELSVGTAKDALTLWQSVPPVSGMPSARASWLRRAVRMVMGRRQQTRTLARSYYRLVRAIHTGTTIPDPARPGQTETTLRELRNDFNAEARRANPDVPQIPHSGDDELDRILLEEIEALKAEENQLEREAEQEIQTALAALGPGVLDRKIAEIDPEQPATKVDQQRQQAHNDAGARQAAAAARVAQNGARSELWNYVENDKAVIGYVRVSRTGTPCGWCAMLISRGPVYKSEKSATYKGGAAVFEDGDKYHDNCNCYAVPIFSKETYASSPMFALNRQYSEEWPRVTRNLQGKAAVSAWRRYIRTQSR